MIIYKCKITNDEMFSDIYKITESANGFFIEVEGKSVTRTEGEIDDSLIGGNASAEEAQECNDTNSVSGVDIVLNHNLQETCFDKKGFQGYLKGYMKAIKTSLQESEPDRVESFMTEAQLGAKTILANFKNYQFFTGSSMNPDGAVGLLDFREDGITPYMLFIKDGLEIEKC
ncbi:translationally-controlled tumor protein homolog [Stegastes partitus]|uniref:Translationally-controlled tumor protein homolog n=1 Tax=Stegastes partitus TaxID=144197 RepID=A0A9Y4JGX5_9TELE|nr:PREDICTED: translationally-controlled tumor protein [Stegastes partitus]